MDWWQTMQQQQALKNPLKISDKALALLAKDFHRFESLDADLPGRIMTYVVDGEDAQVLQDLIDQINAQSDRISQALQSGQLLNATLFHDKAIEQAENAQIKFLSTTQVADAAFYCRFAQVACGIQTYFLTLAAQPTKLQPLIQCIHGFIGLLYRVRSFQQKESDSVAIAAALIDQMLVEAGKPEGTLAQIIYQADPDNYQATNLSRSCQCLADLAEYTLQHQSHILEALRHSELKRRVYTLQMLLDCQVPPAAFMEDLAGLAVSAAKTERELAAHLLKQAPEAAIQWVQDQVEAGKADARYYAVKLLWDLQGEAARPFLESRLEAEKAAKVQGAIAQVLAGPADTQVEPTVWVLPPLEPVQFEVLLPEEVRPALQDLITASDLAKRQNYKWLFQRILQAKQSSGQNSHWRSAGFDHFPREMGKQLKQAVENTKNTEPELWELFYQEVENHVPVTSLDTVITLLQQGLLKDCVAFELITDHHKQEAFKKKAIAFLAHPGVQFIHAVRLMLLLNYIDLQPGRWRSSLTWDQGHELLKQYRKHHPDCGGLRELAAVLQGLGIQPDRIADEIFSQTYRRSPFLRWESDAVWPYFAERIPMLEDALKPSQSRDYYTRYEQAAQRENTFAVLQMFPQPPAELVSVLWELALGTSKTERPIAQRCLDPLPDTPERILAALQNGDRDVRTAAAEWFANRGEVSAVKPLKAALKVEKSDATKDVMLRSLEKLGASVDEFLDRKNLLKDAQKLLKNGVPAALAWMPFDQMPQVHWADTGEVVEPEILKSLIVQCYKQKMPEPGPILRRYVEAWKHDEGEALGQFVLQSWIAQDTAPAHTPEQADQKAQKAAQQEFGYYQQWLQQYQQYFNNPQQYYRNYPQMTPEEQQRVQEQIQRQIDEYQKITLESLHQRHLNHFLHECKGSAIKEKGVLAIAAACCGSAAVPVIGHYLKTWYGNRMAQCKALLQILSWLEDNTAIQLLLSVANRFRTKGIQKEAEQLVTQLAERKGWSRDELADRTIPTAGFEEGAEMMLDYGSRQFTARLDANFNILLIDPEGKVIKSLPNARKEDDPEQVKAAKKQLSDAKKQLKQVLQLQQERLYEAMCTQRSWTFRDWNLFLSQHAIVGRYCQRLVWAVFEGEALVQTFRPLDDGTLTDYEDNEVTVASDATVRLAHTCTVSEDIANAWKIHFADYEVTPLVEQFREGAYSLPDGKRQETEILDFEGHLVEAFQIRGIATKRGYTRGQTEDAGWFYSYHKTFPGLGLEAVIGFSGNFLPEENRTVALTDLSFHQLSSAEDNTYFYNRPKVLLEEIPAVLLSEVWNDVRAIAAQGTGYDPDWERKAEY